MGKRLPVRAEPDFLMRLSQAQPLDAISELIWNSIDEDATTVNVGITEEQLGGVKSIQVIDDGKSLPLDRATKAFSSLGGSNKRQRLSKLGEHLHGQLGQGRYKAFALGKNVVWKFTNEKKGELNTYEIIGTKNEARPFFLTDEQSADGSAAVGCVVEISDIEKSLHVLLTDDAHETLTRQFARFLRTHQNLGISFNGRPLSPTDVIAYEEDLPEFAVEHDGEDYKINIQIIYWDLPENRREIHLCDASGIPLHLMYERFESSDFTFTAFVQSELFETLHQQNLLATIERSQEAERKKIVSQIKAVIRDHLQEQSADHAQEIITRLKNEKSYPYRRDPTSVIEKVERQVFDICAVKVSQNLPAFEESMQRQGRELLLKMIKEALSSNPSSVGRIIREVLKMPHEESERFATLLEDVPLSKVVSAAHMVKERLDFLVLFEAVVNLDPFDRAIKERTELQRLLASNVWLFGEEYSTGTDDQNLKKVLEKHIQILDRDHLQPTFAEADLNLLLDEYNADRKGTEISLERIPDLMVWKKYVERRPDQYEFLVIEIKRPGVAIGRREIEQIEDYARAVVTTPFNEKERTRWVFILISDELDENTYNRANSRGMPQYTILQPEGANYEVRVFPWNVIVRSANSRHQFLKDELEHDVALERAIETSQAAYADYLPPQSNVKRKKTTRKRGQKSPKRVKKKSSKTKRSK